ncbi:MAG: OmpH family outer membrane protein [Flavobacteriia bacterium]|nr:OmpH family outer membrane protein [Flavobacteriia bacterium]
MKKIAYLILCSFLLSISCTAESKKVSNVPKVVPYDLKGLKIVYYSNDSIKENFLFYKQQDAIVTKKQQNFQAELQRRSNEFQEYVQRNSEKEKSGLLSSNEVVQIQQKAQQMEQVILQYQQEQGAKIEEETMKKLEEISKKIEVLGKKFCELNNIDIMLIYGEGGQINYIKPTMDVTKEFIAFLNENQVSIEKDLKK